MREEIEELEKLGRMPNESLSITPEILELIDKYELLLNNTSLPITYEEGEILIGLFPPNAFYDMQWLLVHLIESLYDNVQKQKYIELIDSCPSLEWKEMLKNRLTSGRYNGC